MAVLTPLPMDEATLNRLAHECARDIYPLEDILKSYNVDVAYFEGHIRNHPRFMLFYAEAHALWNSAANFKERSAIKAGVVFEQWLEECNKQLHNPLETLSSKAKVAELLARISGIDKEKNGASVSPGERVVVNINLGAGTAGPKQITIDKELPMRPIDNEIEIVQAPV